MNATRKALESLGLGPDADPADIRRAYRELAQVWHPDRFPHGSVIQQKAQERLKDINAAYRYLREHPSAANASDSRQRNTSPGSTSPRRKRRSDAPIVHVRLDRWVFLGTLAIMGGVAVFAIRQMDRIVAPWHQLTKAVDRSGDLADRLRRDSPRAGAQPEKGLPSSGPENGGALSLTVTEIPVDSANAPDERTRGSDARSVRERRFGIGATQSEVLAIQGTPTEVVDGEWRYGRSSVRFDGGRVIAWEVQPEDPLRVEGGRASVRAPGPRRFAIGWTKARVLAAHGEPNRVRPDRWTYGNSIVFFEDERVSRWKDWPADSVLDASDRDQDR